MPSPKEITVVCDNCKTVVTLKRVEWPDREVVYIQKGHPQSCPQLAFTAITQNPRRLGVITGGDREPT